MKNVTFPIIDAHIHQWDPHSTPHAAAFAVKLLGRYPRALDQLLRLLKPKHLVDTVGLTEHITAPYLPKDYKQDIGQYMVEKVVHVEAGWHEKRGLAPANETRFIQQLPFESEGLKLGAIVAYADPRSSHFVKLLKQHQENSKKFRGIRYMAAAHNDPGIHSWTTDKHVYTQKKFLKGFEALAKQSLSFDAWVYSHQLDDVIQLAKKFPETAIVLDHFATPVGAFGAVGKRTARTTQEQANIMAHWHTKMAELAECKNVMTKMSGLFMPVLGHPYYKTRELANFDQVMDTIFPLVQHVLKNFGTKRVMFASNFPMDRVNVSLQTLISAFLVMVKQHDEHAAADVFYHNAHQFYRL